MYQKSSVNLLGVRVDQVPESVYEDLLTEWMTGASSHMIVTPNPEMLLAAKKSNALRSALNRSDLALPDGFGVQLVSRFKYGMRLNRYTGVDTLDTLCHIAHEQKKRVLFVGGELPEVAKKTAEVFMKRYPGLVADGIDPGMIHLIEGREVEIPYQLIDRIRAFEPDVLAIALGVPKQEFFIQQTIQKLPSVKIAIGVGGALDMISGAIPRAPAVMRKMGLEWLWRLLKEPRRFPRIFRAVAVFPITVFLSKVEQL